MKSLQDYIDTYKDIADKLNLRGDSIELLTQLLANASYISEVENIAYAQEASLEKATLLNSKIQHCINDMYSVFRGACPRVIIKFRPKKYFNFEMFQKIVSGNGFGIYYLGYYKPEESKAGNCLGAKTVSRIKNFVYSPITIPAANNNETYTIVGLLAQKTVDKEWTLNKNNTYYVDCLEDNLSNDLWVKIEDKYYEVSREFSDHIITGEIFDLTLPSFGSRLYVADVFKSATGIEKDFISSTPPNTKINATYFKFSSLSDYNSSDLKKISIKGADLISIDNQDPLLSMAESESQFIPGVVLVSEAGRDNLETIHYKASRDRYVNSILRSNSDIGVVLEEMYPDKIITNGTSYKYESVLGESSIKIFYVPINKQNLLTSEEISNFINTRSSYYITNNITVESGGQYTAVFSIDVELYQNTDIDLEIKNILNQYKDRFNINIPQSMPEIQALISKISSVKRIMSIGVTYMNISGDVVEEDVVLDNIDTCYFQIEYIINSIIQ